MSGALEETTSAPSSKRWVGLRRGLRVARIAIGYVFLASLIVFIWILSYFLVANSRLAPGSTLSDQAALLFGASSLALFILSLVIAVLAIVGWQTLKDHIRERVEERTSERLQALTKEVRGRVASGLGHMIGELSSKVDQPATIDRDRMEMAVDLCQEGYDKLRGLGEGPALVGLDNLVYYKALQGETKDATFLLDQAKVLRAKGFEHNANPLLLTYCRVVLVYGMQKADLKEEAAAIAAGLCAKPLKANERKEAEFYAASFSRAATKPDSTPP